MIGMKKPSPLATFGAAAAMSIASTAAVAQTIEPVSDSVRLVLVYLANNPLLSVAYLARAFDIDANYRDIVDSEIDFDPIRNHPDFLALTTVIV